MVNFFIRVKIILLKGIDQYMDCLDIIKNHFFSFISIEGTTAITAITPWG